MPIYSGCSLFMNGIEIPDTISYTPPEIRITKKAFKTGAMNAPVPVDDGTELMSATYKCAGADPLAFIMFGVVPGVKARLMVRRTFRGRGELAGVTMLEEEVEGFVESIRPDDGGADGRDTVGQLVTVAASHYRVSANGIYPLLEINPILGLRKIAGINVLAIPGSFLSLIF